MMVLFDLFYGALVIALSPYLAWRSYRTGRYQKGLTEKLFGPACIPPGATWFHGVSVGEIHLLTTLVKAYRHRHPDRAIVVSSTTDSGLVEARNRFQSLDTVIAYPLDFSFSVRAALDAIQPARIVLAESELWPNFLAEAARRKIPVIVVNARTSPRSFRRMSRVAGLVRSLLLKNVRAFGVQAAEYAERLEALGISRIRPSSPTVVVTGSVKYDGATGDRHHPKTVALKKLLGYREELVWLVGSTHPPEEEIALRVFTKLRERFPQLRLLLAPRHPDRFSEVAQLVEKSGETFLRRSQMTMTPESVPAVVLLDTLGELGAAWGLADVGFTGGSLDGVRGGQSMIEPAGYGVPTLFGPHVWNFRDAAARLLEAGGAIMIRDEQELRTELEKLLADEQLRRQMGQAAAELVRQQQGATLRTLDLIDSVSG